MAKLEYKVYVRGTSRKALKDAMAQGDEAEAYEAARLANIKNNMELLNQLGIQSMSAHFDSKPKSKAAQSVSGRKRRESSDDQHAVRSSPRLAKRLRSRTSQTSEGSPASGAGVGDDDERKGQGKKVRGGGEVVGENDTYTMGLDDEAEEYEASRLSNMRANAELMRSLGLSGPHHQLDALEKAAYQSQKADAPSIESFFGATKRGAGSMVGKGKGMSGQTGNIRMKSASPKAVLTPTRRSARSRQLSVGSRSPAKNLYTAWSKYSAPTSSLSNWLVSDAGDVTHDKDADDGAESSDYEWRGRDRAKYRRDHSPLRQAERLGQRLHDPKTFGAIPEILPGEWFPTRMACSTASLHAPTVAGIYGSPHEGCYSICLSGGYEDDIDLGDRVTFTGSGGRDLRGTPENRKNLRTAPQSKDQVFEASNAALQKSVETGKPIRLLRGFKGRRPWSPPEGYSYSGLYKCVRAWRQKGQSGFKVCRFELERLPGQPDLRTFTYDDEEGGDDMKQEDQDSSTQSHEDIKSHARTTRQSTSPLSPPPELPAEVYTPSIEEALHRVEASSSCNKLAQLATPRHSTPKDQTMSTAGATAWVELQTLSRSQRAKYVTIDI